MSPKTAEDSVVKEKVIAYLGRIKAETAEDGRKGPFLAEVAAELNGDRDFAEGFFHKIRSLGAELPKGFLAELYPLLTSKQAQKALKKTHYLLTQRGLAPDPLPKKDPFGPTPLWKDPETFQPIGYLSDLDSRRQQMIGMLIPMNGMGRLVLLALIGEEGLESMTVLEAGKKRAKEVLAELARESNHRFYEADFGHVAFLLKEAHDRHSALSAEEERLLGQVMGLLEDKGAVAPFPVIRTHFQEETITQPPLPVAEDLERMPELLFFLPPFDVLKPYFSKVKEVQESPLILNDWQVKERIEGIVRQAVEESYTKERWGYLQRYLEEVAYLHLLRGEEEEARFFYAWGTTFGQEETYPSPADHPLLAWLLDMFLVRAGTEEVPNASEEEEIRTPGGIILPALKERKEGP